MQGIVAWPQILGTDTLRAIAGRGSLYSLTLNTTIAILPEEPVAPPHRHRGLLPFLGLACGVAVGNIYYNQPLLEEMRRAFHVSQGSVSFIAVATQVGYAVGILFFVPLGDVVERRSLILRLFAAISLALGVAAAAPGLWSMIVASVIIGLTAAVTHIIVPIAPELADETERGRAIGTVMTGLLLGILLARTFAGAVASLLGWRAVFIVAAIANLAFVPMLLRRMPRLPPLHPVPYGEALRSLWTLFRDQRLLRESAILGSMVFAAFSTFWTTLAFLLATSHYHLGAWVAGSFGILGASGALIAPLAGRLSDRHGSRAVVTLGLSLLSVAFGLLWVAGYHLAGLIVGVILLDLGVQANQIANQTRIFGLIAGARSRINTVYMTLYFTGASLGSFVSAIVWAHWQWDGVCALGLGFLAIAGLVHATGMRTPRTA